jgi:hypothetical protein
MDPDRLNDQLMDRYAAQILLIAFDATEPENIERMGQEVC